MKYTSKTAVNYIRALAMDEITTANSGHPGIALGAAPIIYALYSRHLVADPTNPNYFNRDRFVLSAGHGSSLLYAMMYACEFTKPTLDDLKKFRQIDSITAGHPEPHLLPGIEVATGPLGQGVAMAVGLAIAEKKLAATYNTFSDIIDHYTYCLHGDGCMEEGIFYEAIAIAGKLNLNKLILLYDSNNIQLDGKVSDSTNTNVKQLFKANNWNYIYVSNGNNVAAISEAIKAAKQSHTHPTVIEIKTTIGYGSDLKNSNACHGAPFNEEQVKQIKKNLKLDPTKKFFLPKSLRDFLSTSIKRRTTKGVLKFNRAINVLEKKDFNLYQRLIATTKDQFNIDLKWFDNQTFGAKEATRSISGKLVNIIAQHCPNLLVGSADLSASTKIGGKKLIDFNPNNYQGQNINYGVREFAMGAIVNGIRTHKGTRAIGSTFLVFSDYAKAAIRLAAISQIPSLFIFSHDSITVGEDGPTHEPIEQINSLRMIPNHYVFRPCNAHETIYALNFALKLSKSAPVTIITSRGEFNQYPSTDYELIDRGAYFIDQKPKAKINLMATGSEVALAFEIQKLLAKENIIANVISAPCLELFDNQPDSYKKQLLSLPVFSIEYGNTDRWYRYSKHPYGINSFGASGKAIDVIHKFHLDAQSIANDIMNQVKNKKTSSTTTSKKKAK